jgi:hypothetical protein
LSTVHTVAAPHHPGTLPTRGIRPGPAVAQAQAHVVTHTVAIGIHEAIVHAIAVLIHEAVGVPIAQPLAGACEIAYPIPVSLRSLGEGGDRKHRRQAQSEHRRACLKA